MLAWSKVCLIRLKSQAFWIFLASGIPTCLCDGRWYRGERYGIFFVCQRRKALVCISFKLPETIHIDRSLLMGSALFGVGWGLAGLCPGPVVSSLLLNPVDMIIFVLIMCAGLKAGAVLKQKF